MRTISTILLLILPFVSFAQQRQVKRKVERLVYADKKAHHKTNNTIQNITVYDKNGREVEYISYGESFSRSVMKADSSIVLYCGKDYTKIYSSELKTYDEKGRIIKYETWYYKDNKKSRTDGTSVLLYNDSGLKTKEINYAPSGTVISTRTFLYDKNGNNTEIIHSIIDSLGLEQINDRITMRYDHSNNNIETVDSLFGFEGFEGSVTRQIMRFDSLKRIIQKCVFYDDSNFILYKYQYAKDQRLNTELRFEDDIDTSLWSIGQTQFDIIDRNKIVERYSKIVSLTSDSREKYIYNKDGLLDRIEFYYGTDLGSFKKYEYEFY